MDSSRSVSPTPIFQTPDSPAPQSPNPVPEPGDSPPPKRAKLALNTGSTVVPYLIHGGTPRFLLEQQQLAQASGEALSHTYQSEPSLLAPILADEIGTVAEQLLSLKGLKVNYDPRLQILTLDFRLCSANQDQRCLLGIILGADLLKHQQPASSKAESASCTPLQLRIYLPSRTGICSLATGAVRQFSLPESLSDGDLLPQLYRLLLQQALGAMVYHQHLLEQMPSPQEHQPLAPTTAESLTVADPDQLGFRLVLRESHGEGLNLTLEHLNPQVAQTVWGTSDPQQLLERIASLLTYCCPQLPVVGAESVLNLPVSTHQLAMDLQQRLRPGETTEQLPPQPQEVSLTEALQRLSIMRERLAVADLYRQGTQGRDNPEEQPLPASMATLTPLHTEASGEGLYCDLASKKWYRLKPCSRQDAGRSEVLMAQLARGSGLLVPKTELFEEHGKTWIISAWQDNLQSNEQALKSVDKAELARLFITAAWLGNSNVIGNSFDHVGVDEQQRVHGLNWRAAGYYKKSRERKPQEESNRGSFLETVFELRDLRDVKKHPGASKVFAPLTEADIAGVVPQFIAQASEQVEALVEKYGPSAEWERNRLKVTLYERLNDLAMRYPDHLPRLTGAELAVIRQRGICGTELTVRCEHIQNHVLTISAGHDRKGETCTQITLRLDREKTAEFARKLKMPPYRAQGDQPPEDQGRSRGTRPDTHKPFPYQIRLAANTPERKNWFPTAAIAIQMGFHGPAAQAHDLDGQVYLSVPGAPNRQNIEQLLQWLAGTGLDIRRPDTETWERHYRQQLDRWPEVPKPLGGSSAPVESTHNVLDWHDNIHRENGRTVMTRPKTHQPDSLAATGLSLGELYLEYRKNPTLAPWIQHLIGCVGIKQFPQLLAANPNLHQAEQISLQGIHLEDSGIRGADLANLNLHGCQLERVSFIDCKVTGMDLSQYDLRSVRWEFEHPDQHQADIAYLANYLEQAFLTSRDPCWLNNLLRMHSDSQNTPAMLPLLQRYGQYLPDYKIHSCVDTLSRCSRVPPQALANYLNNQAQPTPGMVKLRLLSALKAGPQAMVSCLQQADLQELCSRFTHLASRLQTIYWPYVRDEITRRESYMLLVAMNLDSRFHTHLQDWQALTPHSAIRCQLAVTAAKTGTPMGEVLSQLERAMAELPEAEQYANLTLTKLFGIRASIPVSRLFTLDRSRATVQSFLQLLGTMIQNPTSINSKTRHDFYRTALALLPEETDLYLDYLAATQEQDVRAGGGYGMPTEASAVKLQICQWALEQCQDHSLTARTNIFECWHRTSDTQQQAEALRLAHKYLGPEQAWLRYEIMCNLLPRENTMFYPARVEPQSRAWGDFYRLALAFWPERPELYQDLIDGIMLCGLATEKDGIRLDAHGWALEVCKLATRQLPPGDQQQIIEHWWQQCGRHLPPEQQARARQDLNANQPA